MSSRRITASLIVVAVAAAAIGTFVFLHRRVDARTAPASVSPPQTSSTAASVTPRASIDIDMRRQQLIGVRTVAAERRTLEHTIRALGTVKYDETRQTDINVKLDGWIRDLFVDYTGQPVRRGQPLFTLYSPQLLAAENEYVLALQTRDQLQRSPVPETHERAESLVAAARQRLALWDVPEDELAAVEREKKPRGVMTIASPANGFVADKQAIRGMHVTPGQTLYKVADVATVWVEADVYEADIAAVHVGQTAAVTVDAYPGEKYLGRVVYIYPYMDQQTRTNKVRYAFTNSKGHLKPGMFANVEINAGSGEGVIVPTDAVLDSGRERIVFVASGEGRFEPRNVKVGLRTPDGVEIVDGVGEGELVAASAAFFLDSESQLRGSLQSYASQRQAPADTGAPALAIALRADPSPLQTGQNTFEARVTGESGTPVNGADVTVELLMAAMPAMNMPAIKSEIKLSPAGNGLYRGTGEVLSGGRWDVTVTVTRDAQVIGRKQLTMVTR